MLVIGERIHVISPTVRAALEERDAGVVQELARQQSAAGAALLDLNIGPAKKSGPDLMAWLVEAVQGVVDTRLSLDTTNVEAMGSGLERCRRRALINSASAEPTRLQSMLDLATRHGADLIALSLTEEGIPRDASARADVAMLLIDAASVAGMSMNRLYLDPLVLPVSADQAGAGQTIEAIRVFKCIADPAPYTVIGLSNVSNGCPKEIRPLINRVFLVMALGAGLDAAIVNPNDDDLMSFLRLVEDRDESTELGRLLVALHDSVAAMEDAFEPTGFDADDQVLGDVLKTVRVLQNRTLYAHSYLRS